MRVMATRPGFYAGQYRYVGDVFTLVPYETKGKDKKKVIISVDQIFSDNWMKKMDANKPVTSTEPKELQPLGNLAPTGDEDVI